MASKKNAAAESPPKEEAVVHQDENIQQRCAIGDVQSMKGMLDDYVLQLLEQPKYGAFN
jgi:hypothetical protein